MPKKRILPSPDTLYEQAKHALLRDIKNKIEGIITNCPHSFDEESSHGNNSRDGDISPPPYALNEILQLRSERKRKHRFCRKCAEASPHVIEPESLCTPWAEDLYYSLLDKNHKAYFFKSVVGSMQKFHLDDDIYDMMEETYMCIQKFHYIIALIQSKANYIRFFRLPYQYYRYLIDTKSVEENVKNILRKFGATMNELHIPQSSDADLDDGGFPIKEIAEFCRNLRTLYLYNNECFYRILNLINEEEFSSLKKLMIFGESYDDGIIPDIFQQFHCLGVIGLDVISVGSVSFNFYNLHEVYIHPSGPLSQYIWSIFINPSSFLTSLFLTTNIHCAIDVFQLLQDLPSLIKLTISGSLVKHNELDFAATRLSCHPLKMLALADLTLSLYKFGGESECNSISEIAIDDFYLIDLLRWCKNLEVLILDDVKAFSEFVIEEVIYPTEESVNFTRIQDANKFPNLRKIDISKAQYFGKDGIFTLLDLDNDLHNMRFNRCYLSTNDKDAVEKYIMDNDLDVAVIFDSRVYKPFYLRFEGRTHNPHFLVDSID